ncbi:MAG: class I SAM-dependent methyltransferase [Euryarchaeota archaeon]|nr:class I SAM-dependent methyltransferase [Euryarchaeota archaeon]
MAVTTANWPKYRGLRTPAQRRRGLANRILSAVLTPVRFALETGHAHSALVGRAENAAHDPIPWYTYGATAFLAGLETAPLAILEFGGGQSTIWWAHRAARVTTIEDDPSWEKLLRRDLAALPNVEIRIAADTGSFPNLANGGPFDITIVDGGPRFECVETALTVTKPTGLIVVDDTDYPWDPRGEGKYRMLDAIDDAGWGRVDFHGFAPGVWTPHCTSVFFKPECDLFRARGAPRPGLGLKDEPPRRV